MGTKNWFNLRENWRDIMTVKEAIELLQKFPENLEVCYLCTDREIPRDRDYYCSIESIQTDKIIQERLTDFMLCDRAADEKNGQEAVVIY